MLALWDECFDGEPYCFQRDGAPAHTADITQEYLEENCNGEYWNKHMWAGSSPDLSPIENVWPLLQNFCSRPGHEPGTKRAMRKRILKYFVTFLRTMQLICCNLSNADSPCVRRMITSRLSIDVSISFACYREGESQRKTLT